MPPSFPVHKTGSMDFRRSVSILLVPIIATVVVVSAKSWSKPSSAIATSASVRKTPLARPLVLQADRLQSELITIRPTGFDPTEIRRAQGRFLLAVDNKSGLDEVTLQLTHEGGSRVREVHLPPGQLKWREKLNLPPGIIY